MYVLIVASTVHGAFEKSSDVSRYLRSRFAPLVEAWQPGEPTPSEVQLAEVPPGIGILDMDAGSQRVRAEWGNRTLLRVFGQAKCDLARDAMERAVFAAIDAAEGQAQ